LTADSIAGANFRLQTLVDDRFWVDGHLALSAFKQTVVVADGRFWRRQTLQATRLSDYTEANN